MKATQLRALANGVSEGLYIDSKTVATLTSGGPRGAVGGRDSLNAFEKLPNHKLSGGF